MFLCVVGGQRENKWNICEIADGIRQRLLENFSYLSGTTIHVDPATASGECCHIRPENVGKDRTMEQKQKQKQKLNVQPG